MDRREAGGMRRVRQAERVWSAACSDGGARTRCGVFGRRGAYGVRRLGRRRVCGVRRGNSEGFGWGTSERCCWERAPEVRVWDADSEFGRATRLGIALLLLVHLGCDLEARRGEVEVAPNRSE